MKLFAACLLSLCSLQAFASLPKVDNFVLLDHMGNSQELYYESEAKVVVLISHRSDCDAIKAHAAGYQALLEDYRDQGVRVLMINSQSDDSREAIASEAAELGLEIPIMQDSAQIIGRSLDINSSAEVIVIDTRDWNISYRGELDGARGTVDKILAGEQVALAASPGVKGCAIDYVDTSVVADYSRDIAPLLQENCMACHIEGGIGPWAMSEYRMVQGFAPMMREAIRTKRMPPWHADPEVGEWHDSAGMSDAGTQMLVSWIEAGAPRGDGPDPLLEQRPVETEWPLGEPDLILTLPAFDIPATGVVDYEYPVIDNPLDREVWVVAATIIPGDAKVVHHVLMGSADKKPEGDQKESVFQNYIMGYAPGNESSHMPEGTGVNVQVGGVYLLQIHYTPTGKASTDETRVGLYFADDDNPPANFLRQQVVVNPALKIPPNEAAHEERAYFEFWDDATIYSLVPHSHYRGRSSDFELVYPNGDRELILSVPNYDFNWQRTYKFEEPKVVPAGTKIIHRTVYDNSVKNPANPDPEDEVRWGLQSHQEMLYGSVSYSWNAETSSVPTHSNSRSDTAQWMGFMDTDMDGKVQKSEMPEKLRDAIGWKWIFLDRNFDGGLDLAEMERFVTQLQKG